MPVYTGVAEYITTRYGVVGDLSSLLRSPIVAYSLEEVPLLEVMDTIASEEKCWRKSIPKMQCMPVFTQAFRARWNTIHRNRNAGQLGDTVEIRNKEALMNETEDSNEEMYSVTKEDVERVLAVGNLLLSVLRATNLAVEKAGCKGVHPPFSTVGAAEGVC